MNLAECYGEMGADYQGTMQRLCSEKLIERIVLKFLEDPSFGQLQEGLEMHNHQQAFQAAHTLKGISQNLGFTKLGEASAELRDSLRKALDSTAYVQFEQVKSEYTTAIRTIEKYREGK